MSSEAFHALADSGRPSIVFIVHGWGGGIRRHVDELAALVAADVNVLFLEPSSGDTIRLRTRAGNAAAYFTLPDDLAALVSLLRAIGVVRLHVHHVNGLPQVVLDLPAAIELPYDVTLHDYVTICPQLHLVTADGRYCGEPAEPGCAACLAGRPPAWPLDIVGWRKRFADLLRHAARVIAPSKDVAARVGRYVSDLSIEVWPHAESGVAVPSLGRVATLGTLTVEKGLHVVTACAQEAHVRGLPISYRVLGAVGDPLPALPPWRLSFSGEYQEVDLPGLLAAERPHVLWFPAQVPETFAYTLSPAIASGLPIVASDLGAFHARLDGRPGTRIVRWDASPTEWIDALLALVPPRVESSSDSVSSRPSDYRARYLAPVARPPAGRSWPSLDARHFVTPPDDRLPRLSLTELVTAGVACGKGEARAELARRAASADVEIPELRARIEGLVDALSESEHETTAARARTEALETSTTWRMTAPVRGAGQGVKVSVARARAGWSALRQLPRRASLAMTLLRDEGPRAVGARVAQKLRGGGRFRPSRPTTFAQADAIGPLPFVAAAKPRVSIVVPAYGKPLLTFTCLRSVHAHTPAGTFEIIVVDDASPEPIEDALAPVTGVRFERNPENLGFIGSCNRGVGLARGDFVVLLNNDTIVTPG